MSCIRPLRIALFAGVFLALAALSAHAGIGNVYWDDSVDDLDGRSALQIAGGMFADGVNSNVEGAQRADVWPAGGDGKATIADAVAVLRMATGLDPAPALVPLETSRPLNVDGDVNMDVTVPGAYVVAGSLVTDGTASPLNTFALYDTSVSPPVLVDSAFLTYGGPFRLHVPPGTYQPAVICERSVPTPNGGGVIQREPVFVGPPLEVRHSLRKLQWTRPATPPLPETVPFTYSLEGVPDGAEAQMHLEAPGWRERNGTTLTATRGVGASDTIHALRGKYIAIASVVFPEVDFHRDGYGVEYPEVLDLETAASRTFHIPQPVTVTGVFRDTLPGALRAVSFRGAVDGADIGGPIQPDYYGQFSFQAPPGEYVISAEMEGHGTGFRTLQVPLTIPAEGTHKVITPPVLPPLHTVSVTLQPPPGDRQRSYTVSLEPVPTGAPPAAGRYAYSAGQRFPTAGRYVLHVPDGAYILHVWPH